MGTSYPDSTVYLDSLEATATTTALVDGVFNFTVEDGFYTVSSDTSTTVCSYSFPRETGQMFVNPNSCNLVDINVNATSTALEDSSIEGVSTSCASYLGIDLYPHYHNDPLQVVKLQLFLNWYGFHTPVTGVFDELTKGQVKSFQWQERSYVLDEQVSDGFQEAVIPTGLVWKYTRERINGIICSSRQLLSISL